MRAVHPAFLSSPLDAVAAEGSSGSEEPSAEEDNMGADQVASDSIQRKPAFKCDRPWYLRPSEPPKGPFDEGQDKPGSSTDTSEASEPSPAPPNDTDDEFGALDDEFIPDYESADPDDLPYVPYDNQPEPPPSPLPKDFKPTKWKAPCPSLTLGNSSAQFYLPDLSAGTHELTFFAVPLIPGECPTRLSILMFWAFSIKYERVETLNNGAACHVVSTKAPGCTQSPSATYLNQ
jgi:hypothetical protein